MSLAGYPGRAAARLMRPMRVVSRLPHSAGARVCLTFDDGPHREHTPRILDILASREIRSTFFFTGSLAEQVPDLVRAAYDQGHDVANHGYRHLHLGEVSHAEYMIDVGRGQQVLEQIVGAALPRMFRPPYGEIGLRTLLALPRAGHRIVLWTVDSADSWLSDPDAIIARVIDAPLRNGSIVLLHEDYEWTVQALPGLVGAIRARGFGLVPLVGGERSAMPLASGSPAPEGCRRCA